MKRPFNRTERIGDLIQKALAMIIHQDDSHTSFSLVTVMGVTVSRDLSFAKVFVSVMQDDPKKVEETIAALNRSAKSFRYQLAKAVKLRVMPELRFTFDDSTAQGFHLSNLIDAAIKKAEKE